MNESTSGQGGNMKLITKTCKLCGKKFEPHANRQDYCSKTCRLKARDLRMRKPKTYMLYTVVSPDGKRYQTDSMRGFLRSHPEWFENPESALSAILKYGKYKGWTIETREQSMCEGGQRFPDAGVGIERPCAFCGKPFTSMHKSVKYCSSECSRAANRKYFREYARHDAEMKEQRTCERCGKMLEGTRRKYCSDECAEAARAQSTGRKDADKSIWHFCLTCGKKYRKVYENFCSKECAEIDAIQREKGVVSEAFCIECGKKFLREDLKRVRCSECLALRKRSETEHEERKAWKIMSPEGKRYEPCILKQFVEGHPEWFPNGRSAYDCLSSTRKYKGWEVVRVMREKKDE